MFNDKRTEISNLILKQLKNLDARRKKNKAAKTSHLNLSLHRNFWVI